MERVVLGLARLAGLLGVLLAIEGCNRIKDAAAEGPAPKPPAATESAPPSIDNANYSAELVIPNACKHQTACQVQVVVVAKGEYHINDKYPYRFSAQESPESGVSYPKREVGRADGEFQHQKAVLKVPFVADAAGEKKVSGTLSLSVCSAANCLMDKQSLGLNVRID